MTTAELLIAVEDAATAAFPDRAAGLLAVVRRWLWFSAARPAPSEDAEASVRRDEPYLLCAWCARGGPFARVVIAAEVRRRAPVGWRPVRWQSYGMAREPRACLCGACALLAHAIARAELPDPDRVLADLFRALAGSEDGERAKAELGRRAAASRPPVRERRRHCDLCSAHSPEGCVGREPLFLCDVCLERARAAVVRYADPASVVPEEEEWQ